MDKLPKPGADVHIHIEFCLDTGRCTSGIHADVAIPPSTPVYINNSFCVTYVFLDVLAQCLQTGETTDEPA